MGYEVTYYYHERIDGDYNKEEKKTFKKKVGDPFEDVTLERLAGAVMAQLARRDVWIVDVEVFELSKKPVSFKEAKGGIILKNKKFLFDGVCEEVVGQDITPQQFAPTSTQPAQYVNIQGHSGVLPHEQNQPKRPIDWMIFSPEPQQLPEIRQKNLKFTTDKKYPIYEKKEALGGLGEIFTMVDDAGKQQLVSDKFFVPANINLLGDRELGFSQTQQDRDGGKLLWGSATNDPGMPDIRRR